MGAPDNSNGKGKGKGKTTFSTSFSPTFKPQFQKPIWGGSFTMSKGFGKGKGKGKGKINPAKKFDNALKVWVGGLPNNVSFKAVQAHFNQAGKTVWADPGLKGQGVVCYSSVDEVNNAILMLNGSVLDGHVIQVDAWSKKNA